MFNKMACGLQMMPAEKGQSRQMILTAAAEEKKSTCKETDFGAVLSNVVRFHIILQYVTEITSWTTLARVQAYSVSQFGKMMEELHIGL